MISSWNDQRSSHLVNALRCILVSGHCGWCEYCCLLFRFENGTSESWKFWCRDDVIGKVWWHWVSWEGDANWKHHTGFGRTSELLWRSTYQFSQHKKSNIMCLFQTKVYLVHRCLLWGKTAVKAECPDVVELNLSIQGSVLSGPSSFTLTVLRRNLALFHRETNELETRKLCSCRRQSGRWSDLFTSFPNGDMTL